LVSHLLAKAGACHREVDIGAVEALALYDWPMNVRELDSVLRNALLAGPKRSHPPLCRAASI
jgi:DNA-binding NtrC family response regulator